MIKTVTMNAKQYSEHSGYPLKTIKDYCKGGIIPSDRIGRNYLIDVAVADQILHERRIKNMQVYAEEKQPEPKQEFDFLSALAAL